MFFFRFNEIYCVQLKWLLLLFYSFLSSFFNFLHNDKSSLSQLFKDQKMIRRVLLAALFVNMAMGAPGPEDQVQGLSLITSSSGLFVLL